MYKLELTGKEVSLLSELFSNLAELDLLGRDGDEEALDALWDKVVEADEMVDYAENCDN